MGGICTVFVADENLGRHECDAWFPSQRRCNLNELSLARRSHDQEVLDILLASAINLSTFVPILHHDVKRENDHKKYAWPVDDQFTEGKNQELVNYIPPFNPNFKSRRLYSSTVSQKPASLAGASYREDLLLPDPVNGIETPMITTSELEKYFYPLFRRGWEIKRLSTLQQLEPDVRNIWF